MRGQTAIEYLMTYGWAILIILIVAGVLAYYGIFAPTLGPVVSGFSQVAILSPWSVRTSGAIVAKVENRVGSEINITKIYAAGDSAEMTTIEILAAGESKVITFPVVTDAAGTAGTTFNIDVAIEYELTDNEGTYFNSTGSLSGTY